MYIRNRKDTKIQGWYVCALCINQPGILSYCNPSISLGSSFHGGLSRQIQLTRTALTHTMSHCVAYLNHECHLAKCGVVNCTPVLHTNRYCDILLASIHETHVTYSPLQQFPSQLQNRKYRAIPIQMHEHNRKTYATD